MRALRKIMTGIILTVIITSCGNSSSGSKSGNEPDVLKEEIPQLQTRTIDVGKLKMHQDGYSIGEKTELTELQKQIKDEEVGTIEITWIWDCSPKYADMPMKIVYNKIDGVLKLIYTQNNVIEEYKNIMPECLSEFLKNGEKNFYSLESYCKDAKYDFNNREMTNKAVGNKPAQSELDGSVGIVKDYIKENANDASSIKFIEWSKVSSFGEYWVVRCKYKGTNALGGVVTENMWFYIQNNQVIKSKPIE
ncbi:MAG: hypothetical protein BWZ11_00738 [Bacteroidetes bacterium ADurb.BinA395]|nr:MAG: hypothetical protein BWZ11_00738 [Bacteroidetes bacterium ADurb.BinA395]HOF98756.1 hypothetical protein [Paludibacteraceae bacterium]HOR39103.1 hypothetical protein [Paludibacteraceae bacterium]